MNEQKIKEREAARLVVEARGNMMRRAFSLDRANTEENRAALIEAIADLESDDSKKEVKHDRMERGGKTRASSTTI